MTSPHAFGRWKRPWLPPADDGRHGGAGGSARDVVLPVRVGWFMMPRVVAAPLSAASIAVFVASPWIDQQLVWCEWVGLAAALLMVGRIRGWWGELWALLAAAMALAMAFHWAPDVLAHAMNAEPHVGLLATAPIVLWDAVRLALPFWFASRITADPLRAWLPAALVATTLEAFMPAVFPWKLGYAQIAWPVLVQSVDLFGPEVTTFVIFAHAGTLAWLADAIPRISRSDGWCDWAGLAGPRASLVALAICVVNLAYGLGSTAFWQREIKSAPTLTVDSLPADDRRECRSPVKEGGVDEVGLAATASADELTRGQTRRRRRHSIAGRRSVGHPWRTVFPSQPAATGRSLSPGQPSPSKTGPGRGPGVHTRLLKGPSSSVPTRTRKWSCLIASRLAGHPRSSKAP